MFIARKRNRKIASVVNSWERLEKWYRKHLPEVFESLRAPAKEKQIKAFEKASGLTLSEDWRQSLLIHDGQEDVSPGAIAGLPFDSLQRSLSSLNFFRSIIARVAEGDADSDWDERCTSYPEGAIKCQKNNANWIPLGNWDGNCWGIDMDPGPTGILGQVINFGRDEDAKYVLALSFGQFLQDLADELEGGSITVVRYLEDTLGSRIEEGDADEDEEVIHRCDFGPRESHDNPRCAPSLANYQAQWSRAKVPDSFKRAVSQQVEPILPGTLARGDLAEEARTVVDQYIRSMHTYEMKWLKVRPIHKLGYTHVNESIPGIGLAPEGFQIDQRCFGFNATPMPTTDAEEKKLELTKHARKAVREKNAIIKKYATVRERVGSLNWNQYFPPAYDPERDRVSEIRKVSKDYLIVYMVPVEGLTIRYHLKRMGGVWLIDIKDETSDHLSFKRVPL